MYVRGRPDWKISPMVLAARLSMGGLRSVNFHYRDAAETESAEYQTLSRCGVKWDAAADAFG